MYLYSGEPLGKVWYGERGNCGSIGDGERTRQRNRDVYKWGKGNPRVYEGKRGRTVTEGGEASGFWGMKRDGEGETAEGGGHPCWMLTGSSVSGLRGRSRLGIALMYRRLWWRCFGDAPLRSTWRAARQTAGHCGGQSEADWCAKGLPNGPWRPQEVASWADPSVFCCSLYRLPSPFFVRECLSLCKPA